MPQLRSWPLASEDVEEGRTAHGGGGDNSAWKSSIDVEAFREARCLKLKDIDRPCDGVWRNAGGRWSVVVRPPSLATKSWSRKAQLAQVQGTQRSWV